MDTIVAGKVVNQTLMKREEEAYYGR